MPDPLQLFVIARDDSPRVQEAWDEVRSVLKRRKGVEVLAVSSAGDAEEERPDGAELAVVIGGDGAILRACRAFGDRQIPILGVNAGRLGFLADLSPADFRANIRQIESRNYSIARHLMFACEHHRTDGEVETHLGLNEAAILSAGALQMIDVHLEIDGREVTTYSSDGLIVSTPVGSTAHSLSAGGPILRQDLQAFVVTPICPHTLTVRPLVDGADCVYRLTVPRAADGVMLVIDGQIKTPFGSHDAAIVRRADVAFQLARIPGHSYYGTLHRKLGWAGQPRYRTDLHSD
ncbi:MAG: NAD(+)/NADH kinase [Planctomycetaceae bacterium]|nr:NAD(+)/NADH kinase [Planctomycetaceae bacterium]